MDLGEGGGGPGQIAPGRAGQQIGVAAGGQPPQEIQDLLGPTIEPAAAFDVEDSQGATSSLSAWSEITWRAAARTSSTPIKSMQVKAPVQVGRRVQGEQGNRW